MIKDRTREFQASASSFSQSGQGIMSEPLLPPANGHVSPLQVRQEFTRRALDINNGIRTLLHRLESFTKSKIIFCFAFMFQ